MKKTIKKYSPVLVGAVVICMFAPTMGIVGVITGACTMMGLDLIINK